MYDNYNINQTLQDMRQKLDAEYRERSAAISREYQDKMRNMLNNINNQFAQSYGNSQYAQQPQAYPQSAQQQQQIPPLNSEIQNAFMRSSEYQQNFTSNFNQFLMGMFFNQFQNSPFYTELKKFADNAYPAFEQRYIQAANKQPEQTIPVVNPVVSNHAPAQAPETIQTAEIIPSKPVANNLTIKK